MLQAVRCTFHDNLIKPAKSAIPMRKMLLRYGALLRQHPGRIPDHSHTIGNVFCDDRPRTDHGARADHHTGKHDRPRPESSPAPHQWAPEPPIGVGLRPAVASRRGGITVVQEIDVVTDEDFVLDRHPFTDEGVTLNLAARSHFHTLLALPH